MNTKFATRITVFTTSNHIFSFLINNINYTILFSTKERVGQILGMYTCSTLKTQKVCANKKQALLRLSEIIKIPPEEIYTIGDSVNDYEMLEYFKGATVINHNTVLDNLNLKRIPVKYNYDINYIENIIKEVA